MDGLNSIHGSGDENGGMEPANLKINVIHGLNEHEVAVPSDSRFGDLKSVVIQKTGVKPSTHKLLCRGIEKDNNEYLQAAGIKDNDKVLLIEDETCARKSPDVEEISAVSRGGVAFPEVREEVDKLSRQISALQAVANERAEIDNQEIIYLTEMLMRQLLKLDSIEAEGEGKVQRKMEVRRIQSLVETMDLLKSRNASLFSNAASNVPVTTEWETFEVDWGNASNTSSMLSHTSNKHPAPTQMPPSPTLVQPPAPNSFSFTTMQRPSSVPIQVQFSSTLMPSSTKVTEEWVHFD